MYLLTKALCYMFFYAALVYLPLRLIVAAAGKYQVKVARKKAEEQARRLARARAPIF